MASLMENLMDLLEQENAQYEQLLELSRQKTPVIIEGNLDQLAVITDKENLLVEKIHQIDKQREASMAEIAKVLHKEVSDLKLDQLATMLTGRPEEQRRLSAIHSKLKSTMDQMMRVNNHNKDLIQRSLEMVQYNMNVVKSMKTAPETANYNRNAYNSGSMMGGAQKSFDAKQ